VFRVGVLCVLRCVVYMGLMCGMSGGCAKYMC
jgi:hypothetical protein